MVSRFCQRVLHFVMTEFLAKLDKIQILKLIGKMKKFLPSKTKNFLITLKLARQFSQYRSDGGLPPINPLIVIRSLHIIVLRHADILLLGFRKRINPALQVLKQTEMYQEMIRIHLINKVTHNPIVVLFNELGHIAYVLAEISFHGVLVIRKRCRKKQMS